MPQCQCTTQKSRQSKQCQRTAPRVYCYQHTPCNHPFKRKIDTESKQQVKKSDTKMTDAEVEVLAEAEAEAKVVKKLKVVKRADDRKREDDRKRADDVIQLDMKIPPIIRGMMASKIRGGVSISVAKSVLQKSIRRGYPELAHQALCLWFEVGREVKGLMTNLVNRLIVIAGEDCAANFACLHQVDREIEKLRRKKKSQALSIDDFRHIVQLLVQAPKTRVSSWLKAVFSDSWNHEEARKMVEKMYPGIGQIAKEAAAAAEAGQGLDAAHHYAFNSRYPLLSIKYAMTALQGNSSAIYNIWRRLRAHRDDANMRLLEKWYDNENEARIYLIMAHLYAISPQLWATDDCIVKPDHNLSDELPDRLDIPSFMIDMHTSEGAKQGMNKVDFAKIGAKIENAWAPLFNQDWIEIYDTIKQLETPSHAGTKSRARPAKSKAPAAAAVSAAAAAGAGAAPVTKRAVAVKKLSDLDESKVEKKKLKIKKITADTESKAETEDLVTMDAKTMAMLMDPDVLIGQKPTSSWKPYVYIPKAQPKWVFKGPFDARRKSKVDLLGRRYQVFKMLGTSVSELSIVLDANRNQWVIMANLATTAPESWRYEKVHDKINKRDVNVIDRQSLGYTQLSKLTPAQIEALMFKGESPLYLDLLDAALLGCGDMGEHNVLVSRGKAYIIDYDDSTTRKKFTDWGNVYRKTSTRQQAMFDRNLPGFMPRIRERVAYYRSHQDQIEKILGESIGQTLGEMESLLS